MDIFCHFAFVMLEEMSSFYTKILKEQVHYGKKFTKLFFLPNPMNKFTKF